MCCRHYFLWIGLKILAMRVTADLLHEFTNTRIFGLFHNCMWQSSPSKIGVHLLELCEQTGWLSTHYGSPLSISICIYVLSVSFVSLQTFELTIWFSCSQERNEYRFPEHSNETFVLSQRVAPFKKWIGVWLGLLVEFCLSNNF